MGDSDEAILVCLAALWIFSVSFRTHKARSLRKSNSLPEFLILIGRNADLDLMPEEYLPDQLKEIRAAPFKNFQLRYAADPRRLIARDLADFQPSLGGPD